MFEVFKKSPLLQESDKIITKLSLKYFAIIVKIRQ